jgi:hypothetical protein
MQIITTHKGTDFDAAASVMAAKILYPEALAVLPKSLNPSVKVFLSIHKDVFDALTPHEIELEKVMRLIVVDTNKWGRLDQMDRLKKKKNLEIFLWDHHLSEVDIEATWKCEGAAKTWTRPWKNHACFGRGWPSGRWFCLDQINQPRSARIDSRCKMAIRSKLQKSNCRSHRRTSGSR